MALEIPIQYARKVGKSIKFILLQDILLKLKKNRKRGVGKLFAKSLGLKNNIVIKDNGKGFNTADIKENSQGLKNVTARFTYYLNAATCINSKQDEGTEIQIIIPLKKENVE